MHALYLLWLVQERHLSPSLVAAVLAAGDLAVLALEVPTGRFADRFGHRASLILGSVVQVAAMIGCWRARSTPELLAASILVAVGDAFRSGADEALVYRSCIALGREDDFQAIEARARTAELVALVGLTLGGGAIAATWGFTAAWAAEIGLCAVGVGMSCAMAEPPARTSDDSHDLAGTSQAAIVTPAMLALILPASCLDAAASAGSFLAQTSDSGLGEITMVVAAITLFEAAGSAAASRLPAVGTRGQLILAGIGAILCGVGFAIRFTFTGVVLALCFLLGLAHPLRAAAVQRLAADGVRARAASLSSACDMACSTAVLTAVGVWRSRSRGVSR